MTETKEAADSDTTTVHFVDRSFLPRHHMPRSALYPLRRVPFGEGSVYVPAEPEVINYGTNFVPGLPHVALIEWMQALFSYQENHISLFLQVMLDNAYGKSWRTEASLSNAHSQRSGRVQLREGDLVPARPTGPCARSVEELARIDEAVL